MNTQIRYTPSRSRREVRTPLVRIFRVLILIGVWIIVGLAGLVVYVRLVA